MARPTTVAAGIAALAATPGVGAGPFGHPVLVTTPPVGARVVVHTQPHCEPGVHPVEAADLPTINTDRESPDLNAGTSTVRFDTSPDLEWCRACASCSQWCAGDAPGAPLVREAWYWLAQAAGAAAEVRAELDAAEDASRSRLHRSTLHFLNQVATPLAAAVTTLMNPPKRIYRFTCTTTSLEAVREAIDDLVAADVSAAEVAATRSAYHWVSDQVSELRSRCVALLEQYPLERLAPEDGPAGQSLALVATGLVKPARGVIGMERTRRTFTLVAAPVLARQGAFAALLLPTGLVQLCDDAVIAAAPVPADLPDGIGDVVLAALDANRPGLAADPARFTALVTSALAAAT